MKNKFLFSLRIIATVDFLLGLCLSIFAKRQFGYNLLALFDFGQGHGMPLLFFCLIILAILALLESGISLLMLKEKGRKNTITISVVGLLVFVLMLWTHLTINPEMYSKAPAYFQFIVEGALILYFIWVIFYLRKSEVKSMFVHA